MISIQSNSRKKTKVQSGRTGNLSYVVKSYCLEIEGQKQRLLKEHAIYRQKISYVPQMISANNDTLVLELVPGNTLGDHIQTNGVDLTLLKKVFVAAKSFYSCVEKKRGLPVSATILKYCATLANSGPRQAASRDVDGRSLVRLIRKWSAYLMALVTSALGMVDAFFRPSEYMLGFSHSDFHYNNILVCEADGGIYFIDFEESSCCGNFDVDLVFLLVILETNFDSRHSAEELSELKGLVLSGWFHVFCYRIFRFSVHGNERFKLNRGALFE